METLSIADIAADLNVSERYVRKLAKNKEIPTITKPFKGGYSYLVPLKLYLEWKESRYTKTKENGHLSNLNFLHEHKEEWVRWCKNGMLIGRPLADHTIETNLRYVNYYLEHIPRRYNKSPIISLDNLREILGEIDHTSFSKKDNIYKAIRSFVRYLIANKLATEALLSDLKQAKPRRLYPAKKVHCTLEQFKRLLEEANKKVNPQTDYDVLLNVATIATIGFTGLRASELCNLRMQDVDLVNRKIFVYLGKGKKNRVVGMCNRLYEHLDKYLKARPKTNLENFFITLSKKQPVAFDRDVLLHKVKRLCKRLDFVVNLHGLRRTFATIAANSGKPINTISLALGHADLKTTQGYLMTTQDEVVREMQGW